MHYKALLVEDDPPKEAESALKILDNAGRLIRWTNTVNDSELMSRIEKLVPADVQVSPRASNLRVRHVIKHGIDCYLLFNEGQQDTRVRLDLSAGGRRFLVDAQTGERQKLRRDTTLELSPHEMKMLVVMNS